MIVVFNEQLCKQAMENNTACVLLHTKDHTKIQLTYHLKLYVLFQSRSLK